MTYTRHHPIATSGVRGYVRHSLTLQMLERNIHEKEMSFDQAACILLFSARINLMGNRTEQPPASQPRQSSTHAASQLVH